MKLHSFGKFHQPTFLLVVTIFLSQNSLYLLSAPSDIDNTIFDLSFRGVDISYLPEIEDNGGIYYSNGQAQNLLHILKNNGINSIRLRIWNDPLDQYCGKNQTLSFAKRISNLDLKLLLDFHYSDTWADPGHQLKPEAWSNLSFNDLKIAIYDYTFEIISDLGTQGSLPSIVQIGNEITGGMLWDEGKVGGAYNTVPQWTQFTDLLKSAIQAVHDAAEDESIQIMIHSDRGGDNAGCRWFYDNLLLYNVSFDIIGLSYYPWWHGTLQDLKENLVNLSTRYDHNLCVVETAYPWTLDWYDNTTNRIGLQSQLHEGYPATVQGQLMFLKDLFKIVKNSTYSKGIGVYYWAPEVISTATRGSSRENLGFFDFSGNLLNSISAFSPTLPVSSSQTFTESQTSIQSYTTQSSENLSTNGEVSFRVSLISLIFGLYIISYYRKQN